MKTQAVIVALLLTGTISAWSQKTLEEGSIPLNEKTKTILLASDNADALTSPMIIVDGKSYGHISFCKLNDLIINGKKFSIDDIEAIDILKSKVAAGVYGEKGKNGVVLITTKSGFVKKNN